MLGDFKKLMMARFLFTFATQMQAVVLGWRMYTLTQNPLYLGFIGLVEAAPAIGLSLYAGYITDRSRPLFVYRWTIGISLLSGFLLLATQFESAQLDVQLQVIALFGSSFLTGLARSFSQPTIFAAVPRMVSRDELPKASAWMSSAMQIARISGPALGGIIFGWVGLAASAGLVCVILFGSLLAMLLIQLQMPALKPTEQKKSFRNELFSGANFVFKHPILLPALSLDMISVLFGGVTSLLPIYAVKILFIGPKGLGILRAAPAVGATIMSFWLASKDIRERAGHWLLGAVFGFGVCILVFAVSRDFYLSLFALGASGAFDSISMVIRTAAVQLVSPPHMRGRISAVNSIFIGSSNEIGEFESGVAAKLMGTVPSAIFGGVMCLLTVCTVGGLSKSLRQMNLKTLKISPETES